MAMSYQEARRIRETTLKDLILRNVDRGQGAVGSVGSALAERFNLSKRFAAKVTGIKERLDPLNIAKKLTGNVGAALLGRALGRSQEDIRYFSGKGKLGSYRGITQDNDLDNLLPAVYTKVSDGQRQIMKKGDSAADVLAKLYNLFKKNYENEEKRKEIDINFKYKEEKKKQERHEELLGAIARITGNAVTSKAKKVKEPEKKEGPNFLSIIGDAIESVKKTIMEKINTIWATLADIFGKINLLSMASTAANLAKTVGGAIAGAAEAGAGALAAVPGGVAALFLTPWVASAAERRKIEENPNAPEYKNNPYAMKVRGEVKTEEEGAAKNIKKGMKQYRRQEIADVVDSKIDDKVIKEEYGATRGELKKWLDEHPAPISMYQAPSERTPNTLQRLGVEESTAGAGQGSATAARMDPRRTDLVKPNAGVTTEGGAYVGGMHGAKQVPDSMSSSSPTSASQSNTMSSVMPTATPTPPASNLIAQRAQASIAENNNLQLENSKPNVITIDKSSKTIIPGGGSSNKVIMDNSVDVRIDDPSLLKAQRQSFRPV
jgi:hypothetical protein